MIRRVILSLICVGMMAGCTRSTNDLKDADENVGGSNTGMGTPDQTGTDYTTDSNSGQRNERAAKAPTEEERTRADQTKHNNKADD